MMKKNDDVVDYILMTLCVDVKLTLFLRINTVSIEKKLIELDPLKGKK